MPFCLMVPNFLNSSSSSVSVAFKGRFLTYIACASASGSWILLFSGLELKGGASVTGVGAGACFSGLGGAGLAGGAGAGNGTSFMTFTIEAYDFFGTSSCDTGVTVVATTAATLFETSFITSGTGCSSSTASSGGGL
uniref:Uncharacterized protein n=1 Tax=Arundo donax TaxID=35708 RepID=A0A0A8YAP7_ARUDO